MPPVSAIPHIPQIPHIAHISHTSYPSYLSHVYYHAFHGLFASPDARILLVQDTPHEIAPVVVLPRALVANSVEVVPADVTVALPVDVHAHDVLHTVALAVVWEELVSVDQGVKVVGQIHTRPSVVNVPQAAADVSVQDVPGVAKVFECGVAVDHGSYAMDVVPADSDAGSSGVSIPEKHGVVAGAVVVGVDAAEDSVVVRTYYCFSHGGMQVSTAPA